MKPTTLLSLALLATTPACTGPYATLEQRTDAQRREHNEHMRTIINMQQRAQEIHKNYTALEQQYRR